MIKHLVIFKFKDTDPALVNEAKAKLMSLPPLIAEIVDFEVGINIGDDARAYDMVLVSTFESLDTLKVYQDHPEHVAVVQALKPNFESVVTVDYEA
jgi:hypothetical protein